MEITTPSRRQFMAAVGNLTSVGWLTLNWPQIAHAAEHAEHGKPVVAGTAAALTAAEAAEVDAITNLIVPGGDTPGARDAKVIRFIDNALSSFFAGQLPEFRKGLGEFTAAFCTRYCTTGTFASAPEAMQADYLAQAESTPFFAAVRRLTVLGLIALPSYGGNHENLGWKLIGVEDNHFWEPPFGYYDKDYPGFEPYPGTKPYTA